MLGNYEHELICDFAQYYHIYDWKDIPVETAAILACGLPAESRTLKSLNNQKINIDTLLKAVIADQTAMLVWFKTKDGQKNRNRPKSYVKMLQGAYKNKNEEQQTFRSGEDFEAARRRILEGI